MRRVLSLLAAFAVATAAAACAGSGAMPREFRAQVRALDRQGTPSLAQIPHGADANRDPAHWAAVKAEVVAAEARMRASPRTAPLERNDSADFEAAARDKIDQTRQNY